MKLQAELLLLFTLTGSQFQTWAQPARTTADLYWADVDGGGATLVVTPAGESILVDNGENKPLHASRILEVMKLAGVRQIDHLVFTHWHADHYGGTAELKKVAPVRNIYANTPMPAEVPDDPAFPVLMPLYKQTHAGKTIALRPGDTVPLKQQPGAPQISLRSIASNRQTIATPAGAKPNPLCAQQASPMPAPTRRDDGENAKSLVLVLEFGKFRFLDVGDLTWHIEEKLACPVNLIGSIDLYQISHHGLDLSNNPRLVHATRPRVVVVNNSAVKGAEPQSMRTMLSAPGLEAIWQLHANPKTGAALNAPPNRVANAAGSSGNYLKASVRGDGGFTLESGHNGPREDYKARK